VSTGFGRCIERNLGLLQPPNCEAASVTKQFVARCGDVFCRQSDAFRRCCGATLVERAPARRALSETLSSCFAKKRTWQDRLHLAIKHRLPGTARVRPLRVLVRTVRLLHTIAFGREGSDADRYFRAAAGGPDRPGLWAGPLSRGQ
jgi:hypothetical protein